MLTQTTTPISCNLSSLHSQNHKLKTPNFKKFTYPVNIQINNAILQFPQKGTGICFQNSQIPLNTHNTQNPRKPPNFKNFGYPINFEIVNARLKLTQKGIRICFQNCQNLSDTHKPQNYKLRALNNKNLNDPINFEIDYARLKLTQKGKRICFQICGSSLDTQNPNLEQEEEENDNMGNGGGGDGGKTVSFLILLLWGGLMYYVLTLAPNQTPSTDMYLVKKLCFLIGDDGFQLNQVIVSLWNIMGLWPLVYCMLLIPSGRSSKGNVPVWPFLILSFGLGAYGLIPYFVLWRPPPPAVEESEVKRWPLNFLESKLTAGVIFAVGLGLIVNAGLATGDNWREYLQYFGGSRLIHATSLDFALLSTFAPFWVYNDMTTRKWTDKGFWLLPLSVVPFLGPALYLLMRPSLSAVTIASSLPASRDE